MTMSGYKYRKLVHGLCLRKVPAESAQTRSISLIHQANDVYSGGSETELSQRSWIQMIIHKNGILAANKDCMQFL